MFAVSMWAPVHSGELEPINCLGKLMCGHNSDKLCTAKPLWLESLVKSGLHLLKYNFQCHDSAQMALLLIS